MWPLQGGENTSAAHSLWNDSTRHDDIVNFFDKRVKSYWLTSDSYAVAIQQERKKLCPQVHQVHQVHQVRL